METLCLFVPDLSRNRLSELPPEVCHFAPLESLNLYHNCIKSVPEGIVNLQMLTYLNVRSGSPSRSSLEPGPLGSSLIND